MLFNSYIFIFLFLPLSLAGFYLLQVKRATLAKVWLTCFSLWFYGYFNYRYLLLMLLSILVNYLFHLAMLKWRKNIGKKRERQLFVLGIVLNLGVLFYFKYYDFFISNLNSLAGTGFVVKGILLPLGISFFTFQQISFLADTYREELEECAFVDYALFVSFFPQLIAGPIVIHEEMLPQFARIGKDTRDLQERQQLFLGGIYIFVLGLSKKILLADVFGRAVDYGYANPAGINGAESFLVVIFYSLQLYFDFSGYCDMAKGLAAMFGMELANNFNSPYKAVNIIDFWKRWHITLSRFFTKNLYIPLGGNRKGTLRTLVNLFLVFFLSGIWHGAGWNFILWGVMHGGLYIITKVFLDKRKRKIKPREEKINSEAGSQRIKKIGGRVLGILSGIFTFAYVSVAWVYFRAQDISQGSQLLKNIIQKAWQLPGNDFLECFRQQEFWYPMKVLKLTELPYANAYLMAAYLLVGLAIVFFGKNTEEKKNSFVPGTANALSSAILFLWCVVSLSGVSKFLYFNF